MFYRTNNLINDMLLI